MKKLTIFAFILLLISPLEVDANPFEKAFKELEKGLEDLADELEGNDKNKKDTKDNKNLPESWKKENSNTATYKACQKNGGKPKNNSRGYYVGFFDPCLPGDYVVSPATPQECTNSQGGIKTAKSGTDPKNMCRQASQIAQQNRAKMEKEKKENFAMTLALALDDYRMIFEPEVSLRLLDFQMAANDGNLDIRSYQEIDEWGEEVWMARDFSQKGVKVTYKILKYRQSGECIGNLESVLTSDSYDIYYFAKQADAYGGKSMTAEEHMLSRIDDIKKIGGGQNVMTSYRTVSNMFIDENMVAEKVDNFLWTFPKKDPEVFQVSLEFDKPLKISEITKNFGTAFKCYGSEYQIKTATRNKEFTHECYDSDEAGSLLTKITLAGGLGMEDSTLQWAFEDFYSGKNTNGVQTLMFTHADGTKTRVQLNPFHPAIQEAYEMMCY